MESVQRHCLQKTSPCLTRVVLILAMLSQQILRQILIRGICYVGTWKVTYTSLHIGFICVDIHRRSRNTQSWSTRKSIASFYRRKYMSRHQVILPQHAIPLLIPKSPRARFTNGFSIAIQIRWKFRFTLTSTPLQWSLQNFVHESCAVVACAKICCDLTASNGVMARRSFHRVWIAG